MKWKAHTRTAERILEEFEAMHFDKYEKDLINGIISPDNEDDSNHYYGREQTAYDYLIRARKKRLEYDAESCFFLMGVGFHYIQDMWTSVEPDYEDHGLYLDLINRCDILNVHESLERYYPVKRRRELEQFRSLEKRLGTPLESEKDLKDLVNMRKPDESSAFLDLNLSFRVCYRAAELVLKTMFNVSLQESLELIQQEYRKKIQRAEKDEIKNIEALEAKYEELSRQDSTIQRLNKWNLENKLKSHQKGYENRDHIEEIKQEYSTRVQEVCRPYDFWYNINKPELDINKILGTKQVEEGLNSKISIQLISR